MIRYDNCALFVAKQPCGMPLLDIFRDAKPGVIHLIGRDGFFSICSPPFSGSPLAAVSRELIHIVCNSFTCLTNTREVEGTKTAAYDAGTSQRKSREIHVKSAMHAVPYH
jgi:hypothetical protein